jgi:hypothetical protein
MRCTTRWCARRSTRAWSRCGCKPIKIHHGDAESRARRRAPERASVPPW